MLMDRRGRCRNGFTLFEVMLVLVLFVLLVIGLLTTLMTGQASYASAEAYVHVQQEVRRAFDDMTRELREAGGTITASATQLDFQVSLGYDRSDLAACPAGAVCWGAQGSDGLEQPDWSVRYRLDGTQLIREVLDDTATVQGTRILANYVDAAGSSFAWDGGSRTMTTVLAGRYEHPLATQAPQTIGPLTSRVRLRNP
jgi:type II secretory pathway component PulJ